MAEPERRTVLVTGATGYIGGRLVPRLLDAGYRVRCYVREPRKLEMRTWIDHRNLEIAKGDAADPGALRKALSGCFAACYLIHSRTREPFPAPPISPAASLLSQDKCQERR